jgi:hypothetical protein
MSKGKIQLHSYLSHEIVERKIVLLRNKKVMLDKDLAELYQVSTKSLIQAVKRNPKRFPEDFSFRLTHQEFRDLRSQIVTSKQGGTRYLPYCFTEQGVAMLSSVLNSDRSINVNIHIMRTFMKLREFVLTHKDLQLKIEELEKKYDSQFQVVFKAIKMLLEKPKDGSNKRFEA